MRKVILALAIGSAIGYVVRKIQEDGMCDDANRFLSKSKKNLKNIVDVVENEAEYLKERTEDLMKIK